LEEPATLEGGDVLRIANRLLVGRSTRTNDAGIEALRDFAEPLGYTVHPLEVPRGVLHLSTAVTALSDQLVIGLDEVLDNDAFRSMDQIPVGNTPLAACNVLAIGDQVIASGDYAVHDQLEQRGFKVHRLNLSEFERADAGPTCLSLLIDRIPKSELQDRASTINDG
jgi:dimethylargininase